MMWDANIERWNGGGGQESMEYFSPIEEIKKAVSVADDGA